MKEAFRELDIDGDGTITTKVPTYCSEIKVKACK
jgi:hypothetical protein